MKYSVDTIIFDLDGTLVDTGPDIAAATNFTLHSFGIPELPLETIVNSIGGGAEVLLRRCLGERADELIQLALPIFNQRYSDFCCVESYLYPEVRTVLEHYHAVGKKMALATQKKESATHEILKKLEIATYFEVVIGPESVKNRKPHPESVLNILDRFGASAERAVMVGDMASDIQAGKSAGTLTCGILYGYGSEDVIIAAQPDVVLGELGKMLEWFE